MIERKWYHKAVYAFATTLIKIYLKIFFPYKLVDPAGVLKRYSEGVVLYANHRSAYDPLLIISALKPRMCYIMAKDTLVNHGKVIADLFRGCGAIPVNRGTADMAAVKSALTAIESGHPFLIFPEGTRTHNPDGSMGPFLNGTSLISLRSGAPTVPIYINAEKNYRIFGKIELIVGEPVDFSEILATNRNRVNNKVLTQSTDLMHHDLEKLGLALKIR